MATANKTYYHGYLTIPKKDSVDYLVPTTTINDVLVDNDGKTLNTTITEINQNITNINNIIETGANINSITNEEIDAAFKAAGL